MAVYYNENNKFNAQWLRELIREGVIAPGDVDESSIEDVKPADLAGYTQCHFFAGIGTWSYVLRRAGWPDDRQVWTGSCPCQPYSKAGKRAGAADERNLWPAFYHIISQCKPLTVFGEQVGNKNSLPWLDTVHSDLENIDYTVGAVDSPAAGYGAPHIRQRLYWVGTTTLGTNTECVRWRRGSPDGNTRKIGEIQTQRLLQTSFLGHMHSPRLQNCKQTTLLTQRWWDERGTVVQPNIPSPTNGFWKECEWLKCTDGKYRPTQPGIHPLAHGIANRVGRLRGYGNGLVTEQAIEFVRAFIEIYQNS